MAVVIIKTDERLSTIIEGATFYYRRIKGHVRAGIVEKFTNKRNGKTNWNRAGIAMLQYCLLGWKDVIEQDGKAVPFDSEFIDALPEDVKEELVEFVGANASQEAQDVEVKNLPNTPNSSSPMKASPAEPAVKGTK